MKIPNTVLIDKKEIILLIIASKQGASFYTTEQGKLELLFTCTVPKPHYSDNEGHFKVRSTGNVIRSGSPRELDDSIVMNDFYKVLKQDIKKNIIISDYDSVYVTMPEHLKNSFSKTLPANIRKKVKHEINGNYSNEEPLGVLKKFSQLRKELSLNTTEEIKPEARAILKKSNQARKVIQGKIN